jgi:hypothetical protein
MHQLSCVYCVLVITRYTMYSTEVHVLTKVLIFQWLEALARSL